MGRPRWPHALAILALGALGPVLAWHFDPFLPYRVRVWTLGRHPVWGVVYGLWITAQDRPLTVLGFLLPPLLAINALWWSVLLRPRTRAPGPAGRR